jgi:hypothetical protein
MNMRGARFVDLLDDQVVSALGRAADPPIEQGDEEARDGQTEEKPGKIEPCARDGVQRPKEQSAQGSDDGGHRNDIGHPLCENAELRQAVVQIAQ